MIEGKTSSGFEYKVNAENAMSWEFVSAINDCDTEPTKIVEAARILLGREQLNALIKHTRGDRDVTPIEEMEKALEEIIEALPKN